MYPSYLIVDVEDTFLDLLVNLFGRIYECLLYVGSCARRSLHEDQSVLAGEGLALLFLHLTPRIQIALVAYQHNDHVRVRVLTRILQPGGQVVEGLPSRDVVHQQGASSSAVIRACDRSIQEIFCVTIQLYKWQCLYYLIISNPLNFCLTTSI